MNHHKMAKMDQEFERVGGIIEGAKDSGDEVAMSFLV